MKKFLIIFSITFVINTALCRSGWIEQYSTGLEFPTSIAFADSSNGFITGFFSCARTSDGGASWLTFNPAVALRYSDVSFVNSDTGFLIVSNLNTGLYRTLNKGVSWTRILSNINIKSYQFINPHLGYLAEVNGNINRTTDGGMSWSYVFNNHNLVPVSISFADENHGILIDSEGRGLSTTDGGSHWSDIFLATGYGGKVSYPAVNSIYVASNSRDDIDVLRKSTDNAQSWTSEYFYFSRFTDIRFLNAGTGTVSGNHSLLMRTTDGGVSWIRQSISDSFFSVSALFFLNVNLGWLINSEGVVYKTYDGGGGSSKN